jgi:hypothetical protein
MRSRALVVCTLLSGAAQAQATSEGILLEFESCTVNVSTDRDGDGLAGFSALHSASRKFRDHLVVRDSEGLAFFKSSPAHQHSKSRPDGLGF